ncbi:hypothetical protein [Rhizobium leguminosarum]|uniref:Uncharacterized protein n=1 Tax=Rhizobium leguminosarum TaxID=384 RepID=A0A7K3VJ13_RHILE|nr:hypothetical protein [Rhizobium leguminosarum]NEK17160.1 hypothetical protein [Rhizobium leguminosarum]
MSPETRELQAFTYSDRNGVNGESETPLPGAPSSDASVAGKEAADLSFARVKNGRKDGSCLSRLGVPTFIYQNLMTSTAILTATSLLKTSFGEFDVSIARGAVDALGGSVLDFRPVVATDSKFLQKGLSGATIVTHRSGDVVPFAMVLRVDPEQNTMRGLRFDYVRERFDAVEPDAVGDRSEEISDRAGATYKILSFSANADGGSAGPSSLQSHDRCWRASPQEGKNQVELQIEVVDPLVRLETLELAQTKDCTSGPFTFFVEQRAKEETEWVFVGKCKSDLQREPCRIGLQAPRQFRLRIDARGPIAVSDLSLR